MTTQSRRYKVMFVNYGLGRGTKIGTVAGVSGKTYAQSRYKNGRHESEPVTLERYQEIIEDVAGAWSLPMRKWVPMFVEEVEDKPNHNDTAACEFRNCED